MPFLEHLNLNKLSSVEQEIYRYIVNNLDKIPYMRVRDIADNAHVSATSVFRFVNKVGFDSFPEFRFYLKNHLDKTYFEGSEQRSGIEQRIKALTMDIFHPDVEYQIEKLSHSVQEADFILFVGLGASGAIAQYAARKLANLEYFCINLDEVTYPIRGLLRDNKKNIVIFISVSGETKELIELIAGLENHKSTEKYCITQNKESSLARLCDYSIEYKIKEERKEIFLDLSSQLPAVAILETLIGYLY